MKKPNIENTPIKRLVELSTEHITEEDGKLLGNAYKNKESFVCIYPNEYGAFVVLGEEKENILPLLQESGFSKEFINLLQWGYDNCYDFLRLDSDADSIADLPTYSW